MYQDKLSDQCRFQNKILLELVVQHILLKQLLVYQHHLVHLKFYLYQLHHQEIQVLHCNLDQLNFQLTRFVDLDPTLQELCNLLFLNQSLLQHLNLLVPTQQNTGVGHQGLELLLSLIHI